MDKDAGWIAYLKQNVPFIGVIAAAFYIALRILGAAGFDSQTAYAILQAAGTGSVLAGAALAVLAFMAGPIVLREFVSFMMPSA